MTMPYTPSKAVYHGNGVATLFPFYFKVWDASQLEVSIVHGNGATTIATGWTVQLTGSGGTVTYLYNNAPLPVGYKLAILRNMPFVQNIDLISGTRFDPEVLETQLDKATAERQQLLEMLGRAVMVEPGSDVVPEDLIADIRQAAAQATQEARQAAISAGNALASQQAAYDILESAVKQYPNITDANQATKTGLYFVVSPSLNTPDGANYFLLHFDVGAGEWGRQIAWHEWDGVQYERYIAGGVWSAWRVA